MSSINGMNDRELVSALMDGELAEEERARALDLLARDPSLAENWRRWQLVRSTLKHEASDAVDLSGRIAVQLADEPAILAPAALRRPAAPAWRHRAFVGGALAACLTLGIGLMVWNSSEAPASGNDFRAIYATAPQVTVVGEAVAAASPVQQPAKALSDDERESAYIVAHAEYSHHGLQTGLRNFTRVAMADENLVADNGDGL